MAHSTRDRITRFASPSRYDSTAVPQSFLDARKKRSASRDSLDKKADCPSKLTSSKESAPVEIARREHYLKNNVPIRVTRPHLTDNRDSDSVRLQCQVESLEARVRTMRQNRNVFINFPVATSDVDSKLNNSLSVDTQLSQLNHSHPLPDFMTSKSTMSFDGTESPDPSLIELHPPISNGSMNTSVTTEVGNSATMNTSSSRRPEITKIHSRVHKRILIQTGSTTQAKTFTYQHYSPSSNCSGMITSTHSAQEPCTTSDSGSLYPTSTASTNGSQLADSDLDHLAMHMGLLKNCATPTASTLPSHTSTPTHSTNVSDLQKHGNTIASSPINGNLSRTESEAPSTHYLPSSNKVTPHKRTRTGGILSGLLKRFSPGINRRSKSFSPTRMRMDAASNSNGLQGLPENFPINMEDSGKNSSRHSRSNSHEHSEVSQGSTGGGKISRLFRNKRFHKKHSQTLESATSEGTPEKTGTFPSCSGKDRILMESLARDRILNPYEVMKQHQRVSGDNSSIMGTPSRQSISSSTNTTASQCSGMAAMRVVYQPADLGEQLEHCNAASSPAGDPRHSDSTPTPIQKEEHLLLNSSTEPPRYLGVSISAFGYSAYGYKPPRPLPDQRNQSKAISKQSEHSASEQGKMNDSSHSRQSSVHLRSSRKMDCTRDDVNDGNGDSVELRRRDRARSTSEEKEARQRSSLIMMQVAQASPRSRYTTTSTEFSTSSLTRSITSERALSTGISPLPTPTTTGMSFLEHLQPIGEVATNVVEDDNVLVDQPSFISDDMRTPRSLSIGDSSALIAPPSTLLLSKDVLQEDPVDTDEKDGRHFLQVVSEVESQLMEEIEIVERDLSDPDVQQKLSEEVDGQLRTAIGKANLLINDKFAQFRCLCEDNLYQRAQQLTGVAPSFENGHHFITLASDLEGFWAMVQLQVDDVVRMFKEIRNLRERDWKPLPKEEVTMNAPRRRQPAPRKKPGADSPTSNDSAKEKENSRAVEARKRLIAAKKEAMMKLKQNNAIVNDELIIFH